MKLQLLTVSLFCVTSNGAVAGEFQSAIESSSVIAEVVIASSTNEHQLEIDSGCGFSYQGSIKMSLTNERIGSRISFRSNKPLTIATAYLVFLTDQVSSLDSTDRAVDIQSSECLDSGISLTAVKLPTDGLPSGRELIFEHRWLYREVEGQRIAEFYYVLESAIGDIVSAAVGEQPPMYAPSDEVISRLPQNRANTAFEASQFLEVVKGRIEH